MRKLLRSLSKAWNFDEGPLSRVWSPADLRAARRELFEESHEGQWRGYTVVLLVCAFFYPYWSWVYAKFGVTVRIPPLGEWGVAAICLSWALAIATTPIKRRASWVYFTVMSGVMAYHFYLLQLNAFALPLVVSFIVAVMIGAAPMANPTMAISFFALALLGTLIGPWEGTASARFVTMTLVLITSLLTVYQLLERIMAGQALKRSESQLKKIFDRAPVGMVVLAKDRRVIRSNTAFQQMLGYTDEELVRRTVMDVTHEEDLDISEKVARRIQDDADYMIFGLEKRYVRKDGQTIWVRVTGGALDDEGKILSVVEDIDVQKKQEQEIEVSRRRIENERAKAMASSKMASLGEMASGVAHEVNNPLAIILGQSQMLLGSIEAGKSTPLEVENGLRSIEKTAHRIAKIVKGLRTFARDAASDPFVPACLLDIIQETLSFCQSRLTAHGVSVKLEVSGGLRLQCRPTQISQVLLNLITNAHDAVEKLKVRWIEIRAEEIGEKVVIRVTDSGSGIPDSVAERLMQPFFTTKEVGKGTGLGLSISRGIVIAHGGRLTLDRNCPNTSFVIELPKSQIKTSVA